MKTFYKTWAATLLIGVLLIIEIQGQDPSNEEIHFCIPCSELKNLRLPDVTINLSEQISPDSTNKDYDVKSHCKVAGVIGKEINFELLLPDSWNGRFAMGGGGGFVGNIQNMARYSVNRGFATAGTDTGHEGDGLKAGWALNNMERQVNFGHLAIHRTAAVAKVLIYNFYCSDPEYSYFIGCSRGGGQAMMEAQRYPDDFDGIVTGAPAFNWPELAVEFIQNMQAVYPNQGDFENPIITRDNLKLLQKTVLEACDQIDGLDDGIMNDPRDCNFDLSDLPICKDDQAGKHCFTKGQIEAIRKIYEGVIIDGKEVYPGFPFGGENDNGGWISWIVGPNDFLKSLNFPSLQFGFGTEVMKYLIYNDPDWDYLKYDFTNFEHDTKYAASYLNATSTDYTEFKANNNKMIIYHGWEDAALSALSTINYFESVKESDSEVDNYLRLYLLPGVLHCGGGPGPDEADWLHIIQDWVENGEAPGRVVVSKKEKGKIVMSRPVYPYPRNAVYKGEGDPNIESSFK